MTATLTRPRPVLETPALCVPAPKGYVTPAPTGNSATAEAAPAPASRRSSKVRAQRSAVAGSAAKRLARGAARVLLAVVVGTAVAAFLFLAVGPRVLGYQTSTMLTGSMSPLINPGDVVVAVPVPVGNIRVGDIITYHIPVGERQVETHRVVDVNRDAQGSTSVRTKGDANNGVDPWTATLAGDTVYRHAFTVPYLGTAIRALRDPLVLKVLLYGAPAVLLIGALTALWKKDPSEKGSSEKDRSEKDTQATPKPVTSRHRAAEATNA